MPVYFYDGDPEHLDSFGAFLTSNRTPHPLVRVASRMLNPEYR
jgi:hypothetical protein